MTDVLPKPLFWIASSRKDMRELPASVRRRFGVSLYAAQSGKSPSSAKSLKGFGGSGVIELIEDDSGGTYRAVYTVRLHEAIYVLHVFQKKSTRGIATPEREINLIRERLKRAGEYSAAYRKEHVI